MKRFAIEVVRGNSSRILATYDTKEQGYEVGKAMLKLSLVKAGS